MDRQGNGFHNPSLVALKGTGHTQVPDQAPRPADVIREALGPMVQRFVAEYTRQMATLSCASVDPIARDLAEVVARMSAVLSQEDVAPISKGHAETISKMRQQLIQESRIVALSLVKAEIDRAVKEALSGLDAPLPLAESRDCGDPGGTLEDSKANEQTSSVEDSSLPTGPHLLPGPCEDQGQGLPTLLTPVAGPSLAEPDRPKAINPAASDVLVEAQPSLVSLVEPPAQETHSEDTDAVFQGTVQLKVKSGGRLQEIAHFVTRLRENPRMRVLQLVGSQKRGVDIWVTLCEPLPLKKLLCQMGATPSDGEPNSSDAESLLMVSLPQAA